MGVPEAFQALERLERTFQTFQTRSRIFGAQNPKKTNDLKHLASRVPNVPDVPLPKATCQSSGIQFQGSPPQKSPLDARPFGWQADR